MEKNVTTSPMSTSASTSLLARHVYCVCFPQRDGLDFLHGELARARESFYTGGAKAVRISRRETIRGYEGKLRGKLSRRGFFWRKTVGPVAGAKKRTLEESFDQPGGTLLVTRDFQGLIKSRVSFLAPVLAYPGENELESLALGALRVLRKEEELQNYDSQTA